MRKNNTILVLPGSCWQIPLVKKVKEMGHRCLVVNPYPNSPCFEFADGHLQSDIFAYDTVLKYAEDNCVDAVMSDECDIAMPLIAKLNEDLSLKGASREMAALFTDKFLMREFCLSHGLDTPEYRLCKTVDEAVDFLRLLNKPIIIKPLDSNASHGVFKCETEEDIVEKFEESMSFSRIEKAVLAERYIVGTEFTIDGVKTPAGHFTLAISEKKHFKHNVNIANELLFSHSNPSFDYDDLRKVNDRFVEESGLAFGFTHAEYKYENGKFYLIEIAMRGGGNMISSAITQYLSGYDTYRYLVNCYLGEVEKLRLPIREEYRNRCAVLKFFATPKGGGIVSSIDGLDYLDSEPDVVKYMLNFKVGDAIEDAESDSARIGFYIACSENMEKLRKVMDNIENKFEISLK